MYFVKHENTECPESINQWVPISPSHHVGKATGTPDRTISESYDWLRLGQGATDLQCLLRSPAMVAYGDRSLRVVALS